MHLVIVWILWTALWFQGQYHWREIAAYPTQQACINAAMEIGPAQATVCIEDQ